MDCTLCRDISLRKLRPKKLFLKNGAFQSEVDEKIPKIYKMESLSTNDSDFFNSSVSPKIKGTKTSRSTKRVQSVEDHPLFLNLSNSQVQTFYNFVSMASYEFNDMLISSNSVRRTCLNETNLLRFLKARNFKIQAAMKMWKNWVQWRSEFVFPTKQDVEFEPIKKHFKIMKHDKDNNPLVIITPGLFHGDLDIDVVKKVCVYVIEKATRKSERQSFGTISVIFDRQGISQSKDRKWFPVYKMMGHILQDFYPERLHVAHIVNANWFTKLVLAMCKVFMAKETRQKLNSIKDLRELENYIEYENIPKMYKM